MECILRKSGCYINRQEGRIPFSSFAFFLRLRSGLSLAIAIEM